MKVFLDLGTHHGEGLIQFVPILKLDETWQIHCFEPNPLAQPENTIRDLQQNNKLNVMLHRAAAWIKDGMVEFKRYGSNGQSEGSLVADTGGGKEYGDYHSSVTVAAKDVYKLIQSFDSNDEIYIKMDIEWSEYALLEDFISRGWPKKIKKIWIEWHNRHVPEYIQHAERLTTTIKSYGTDIVTWGY